MRAAVPVAGALALALLTGCTGGGSPAAGGGAASVGAPAGAAGGAPATRWWSNSAVRVGSVIDPAHPDAAAARLHPSAVDYCGMLRDTVHAGRSVLSGVGAQDPALLASTRAFLAELQRVAPAPVARPWQTISGAVEALFRAGGDAAKAKGVDAKAVQRAGAVVAAHAKRSCHLDVTAARP